jgi:ribokinase
MQTDNVTRKGVLMARVLVLGSLNIDYIYDVNQIVKEGETISAHGFSSQLGGKGVNQAVAAARAGAEVSMAGAIGYDGSAFLDYLSDDNIETVFIEKHKNRSGHAIIQLTSSGKNSIVVYAGTNNEVSPDFIDRVLAHFGSGDYILLQNEVSCVAYAMRAARKRGIKIVFNPSPITDELLKYPLELVDIFILNEIEGQVLSELKPEADCGAVLITLTKRFPNAAVVLTMGGEGVIYSDGSQLLRCGVYRVPVVDTTAAGDTFCGYFLAAILKGLSAQEALELATKASNLAIGKKGALVSIPKLMDIENTKFEAI